MLKVTLSNESIEKLGSLITGDSGLTPYQTGPQLVEFLNRSGRFIDSYGSGFPSRWLYVEEKLKQINGTDRLTNVIENYFSPNRFIEKEEILSEAIDQLNKYLIFDGYELSIKGLKAKLYDVRESKVEMQNCHRLNRDFARESLAKCKQRILDEDYSGAITSARSLVEDVISRDIHVQLKGVEFDAKGDLIRAYNAIKKELNLLPEQQNDNALKQVVLGLTNIVHGLAETRNKMSDSHSQTIKPESHHARFVVSSALLLTDFLYDSLEFQTVKKACLNKHK